MISNLFGLTQIKPWRVWVYGLKVKEAAVERNIKSLLNSACLRLTNKFRHPFFYQGEAIISLVDIGDGFEDDYYILERGSFNPDYFLNGQEAWGTFINSFANLLMSKGKIVETVANGLLREYTLDVEFINDRAYLRIDFGYILFSSEDLDRQLEKGGKPEIGGKYYTPNGKIAILKDCTKLSKEDYKKLMEEMSPRSLDETRVAWEEGLKRAIRRGYGHIAKVVFKENDRREYTYPANALKKVRYMGDLNRDEWDQVHPPPQQRWELIKKFRNAVASLLREYSIDLDVHPYAEIEYINPTFEVVDGGGKPYLISISVRKVLDTKDWKPIIRNPCISVGFLFLYTDRNSFRDLQNRARIIDDTVLKKVSSFGVQVDHIEPIWVPLSEYKENRLLSRYIENLDGSTRFLFVLTDASELDDELYLDMKRELLGFDIQSQVIYHRTNVRDENVAKNLMLGFLGKTGNYPYFLKEHSNNVFVGIDLSRKVRSSGKGTLNAVGTAIIVDTSDEGTITYKNINIPAGGEAVEKAYVKSLANLLYKYKDKFIVIHRDGKMSMDELNAYVEVFSKQFGKENFALVSILKSGTPRILRMNGDVVENPPKGCAILLSELEAVIATYKTFRGTHIPLRIKVLYGDYPLKEAIEDVLKLTLLNFSSFTLGKLPATVAFADRIAWYNLHGIAPEDADGNLFFL